INSKNTFSGRYIFDKDPITAPLGAHSSLEFFNALPGIPITAVNTDQNAIAKLTSILSNNAVNDFHVAYQRTVTASTRSDPVSNSQFGIQDFVSPFAPGGRTDRLSNITVNGSTSTGLFSLGPASTYGGVIRTNQYTIGDQISWTR